MKLGVGDVFCEGLDFADGQRLGQMMLFEKLGDFYVVNAGHGLFL
ncbi:hypothetical protein GGI1_14908 [Acidithiobacillus sp. GGI-221]|nr:hypothetical protein GGI1_14908 [Acidithiobacillus sp. GGI-221]